MKILIIGLGSIGKKHVNALLEINQNIEIYALRSSKTAQKYLNVSNIYQLDELSHIALDFCIVSTPTAHHAKDILKLIKLNIPLFIEKPLFSSLNNKAVLTQIAEHKINTYVACNLRFLECLQYVKKNYLTDDSNLIINEVNAYCGSYLPDWRPGTDFRKSYSANEDLGGGVHIDLIHEIDYLFWFFGQPLKVNKTFKSQSSLKINAIDYANFTLMYENFTASVVLNYFRRDPKRQLEIVFDQFTLKVDLLTNSIYKSDELIFSSDQKTGETYKAQLQHFIDNLNVNSFNTVEEAYDVLKICLE